MAVFTVMIVGMAIACTGGSEEPTPSPSPTKTPTERPTPITTFAPTPTPEAADGLEQLKLELAKNRYLSGVAEDRKLPVWVPENLFLPARVRRAGWNLSGRRNNKRDYIPWRRTGCEKTWHLQIRNGRGIIRSDPRCDQS